MRLLRGRGVPTPRLYSSGTCQREGNWSQCVAAVGCRNGRESRLVRFPAVLLEEARRLRHNV